MEDEKTEHESSITGQLQNVSPIRTSIKTMLFDMQIQTAEDRVNRGVCLSLPHSAWIKARPVCAWDQMYKYLK